MPGSSTAACTGVALPEGIHSEAELFLGRVGMAPYVTPGTPAIGEAVANVGDVGSSPGLLATREWLVGEKPR